MPFKRATISFQYMAPGDEKPRAGYEITDVGLDIPDGAHVPRVGEFLSTFPSREGKVTTDFVVLAVHTTVSRNPDDHREIWGWHTVVTVGPADQVADQRLLIIRE